MTTTNKHLVFLFRSSPYGGVHAKEGLDALLAASIFEQEISVIFMGDGISQLAKHQNPTSNKSFEKMLSALPMYDVTAIFALEDDLESRGLSTEDCCIKVSAIPAKAIYELLNSADHVLSY